MTTLKRGEGKRVREFGGKASKFPHSPFSETRVIPSEAHKVREVDESSSYEGVSCATATNECT